MTSEKKGAESQVIMNHKKKFFLTICIILTALTLVTGCSDKSGEFEPSAEDLEEKYPECRFSYVSETVWQKSRCERNHGKETAVRRESYEAATLLFVRQPLVFLIDFRFQVMVIIIVSQTAYNHLRHN